MRKTFKNMEIHYDTMGKQSYSGKNDIFPSTFLYDTLMY